MVQNYQRKLQMFMFCVDRTKAVIQHFLEKFFKDARSVSLYPYNRSQILQYVKYTK